MRNPVFALGLTVLLAACQNKTITPSALPTTPTNFRVTQVDTSSIGLAWDAVPGATGYVLERKTGSAPYAQIAAPTATAYTDASGLSAGTEYRYRLSAAIGTTRSQGAEQVVRTMVAAPAKFTVETLKDGLDTVWAMRFAPDGRLLFTLRADSVVTVHALNPKDGLITDYPSTSPVLNEIVSGSGEAGVLGMDLDPNFAANGKVYICYTYGDTSNYGSRLSSFVLSGNSLGGEQILLQMGAGEHHNGCRVVYGPDGKVYVGMGDHDPANDAVTGPNAQAAQDLGTTAGKILRVNPDGSIPADNPFVGVSGARPEIWSFGHRNPQGLAFQPSTGTLWSTEHGPQTRDEVNVIKAGKNYGWPLCSGTQAYGVALTSGPDGVTYPCTGPNLSAANYQPAAAEYSGGDGASIAPSDLIFYTGSAFPGWTNDILFVTLKTGRLYHLKLSGENVASSEILIGNKQYGRLRDLVQGPDGLVYISTDEGKILRLTAQ